MRLLHPLLTLFICGLLLGCTTADNSLQNINERGTLIVGLDPTFPPFENADTGELQGLDVDLARAIAAEMGVRANFRYFGYDGLYDALATEQVDVLISALVVDEMKTRDFAYSNPYFNAGQFLVVAEGSNVEGMAALSGRTIAVELGSEGHVQAIVWERRLEGLIIRPLPTADDALWLVLQGEVDAALVDQVSGRHYRQQAPTLRLVAEPVTVEPYALVVRIADRALLRQLNEALTAVEKSGQLAAIQARWLDGREP